MSTLIALLATKLWVLQLLVSPSLPDPNPALQDKARGITLVATKSPFKDNPIAPLQELGADWVAVVPIGFSRQGQTQIRYDISPWQWWGERPEGLRTTIELAHNAGLKVMLKPQIYIHGSWPGGIDFKRESDWKEWERSYLSWISQMTELAQETGVELFCIGTEVKISATTRPRFWRDLADQVRGCYTGQLVYAANWDEYQDITFWDKLDFIGVDAYFPLSDAPTPTVHELVKAWSPIKKQIKKVQSRYKKPVLFTEYGYLSVDQCAHRNWELEKRVHSIPVNEQAQANALEAVYISYWNEPWWGGSFLWKWFPGTEEHEGYPERDYTPQGKKAENVINKWFTR